MCCSDIIFEVIPKWEEDRKRIFLLCVWCGGGARRRWCWIISNREHINEIIDDDLHFRPWRLKRIHPLDQDQKQEGGGLKEKNNDDKKGPLNKHRCCWNDVNAPLLLIDRRNVVRPGCRTQESRGGSSCWLSKGINKTNDEDHKILLIKSPHHFGQSHLWLPSSSVSPSGPIRVVGCKIGNSTFAQMFLLILGIPPQNNNGQRMNGIISAFSVGMVGPTTEQWIRLIR